MWQHPAVHTPDPFRCAVKIDIAAARCATRPVDLARLAWNDPPSHQLCADVIAAGFPGQGILDERNIDCVAEGLDHFGRRRQQIVTVNDRRRCAVQRGQQVEQRALFGKADFQLVEIRPSGTDRCDRLRRVADQKGVG